MEVKHESTLLEYLFETMKGSKNNIKSRLKNGDVVVNGKIITQYNYMVAPNDQIEIYRHIMENDINIPILYEDKELIAIDKPAGLLSIATEKEKNKTAYHLVSEYVKKQKKQNKVFSVHRLDQDTSGILLFAKKESIKNILQKNWNEQVKRHYIALVEGKIPNEKGTIHTWLSETKTGKVYSIKNKAGKEAITYYQILKQNHHYTLLNIQILTGRKHQIRVHLQEIGYPIVGDKKYGKKEKRLYLHANVLEFIHPTTKKKVIIQSRIPKYINDKFLKK